MDAADREPAGHHGHRVETSLLPLKKRAINYSSGPGRISADDTSACSNSSKKKRVEDDDVSVGAETKDTTGACEAPVPASAAASPEPEAEGNALSDEEKRLNKGKWLARKDSSSLATVTPQPPVKKLMHDGIRSFVPQQLSERHQYHAAEADDDVPSLHGSADLSEALQRRLAELGATRPWLVHKKTLHKSDVDENQNRLLVSCKRGSGLRECPITRCFSPAERERVENKNVGLWVTALDGDGVPYALTCKFLDSNNGYRFISAWKDFLTRNGINLDSQKNKVWTRDVEVELWAFRSRQLPFQPQLDAEGKVVTITLPDEDNKDKKVVQRVDHHLHRDGSLGFILLHHENRRRLIKSEKQEEHDDDDDDDWKGPSSPSVARKKGKQQSGNGKRQSSASSVALPAPVAEQGGARWSGPTFYAAVGLAKLQRSIWGRWQEHVDQGHGANKGFSNDVAKSPAGVEAEKIKKPGNAQHKKNVGPSSQTVDSLGNMTFGTGGRKKSSDKG